MPALDTCATALWGALRRTGIAPSVVRGWCRLFDIVPPARGRARTARHGSYRNWSFASGTGHG